jgi:hypothetical protein
MTEPVKGGKLWGGRFSGQVNLVFVFTVRITAARSALFDVSGLVYASGLVSCCLVSGVWCLVSGVWCLVSGVWCLVSGVWCLLRTGKPCFMCLVSVTC